MGSVDWIDMAQDRKRWPALVNVVFIDLLASQEELRSTELDVW